MSIAQRNFARAVQLWAVAARWREEMQLPMMPAQLIEYKRSLEQVQTLLGGETFTSIWEASYRLSPDEVWPALQSTLHGSV